ncbi:MAG: TadE/TadG family type IV pilus assembly protein [Hasllibacter sp.]
MRRFRLSPAIRRFARDEDGVLSIEAAFSWPLLCAACALMFVMWDGFRARTMTLKGNYVISDMIARNATSVGQSDLDTYNGIFELISASRHATAIRVSVISASLNASTGELEYTLDWSQQSGGIQTATTLADLTDQGGVPDLVNGESVVVVDTFRHWFPMRVFTNFPPQIMSERVVTRPRFAPTITWL